MLRVRKLSEKLSNYLPSMLGVLGVFLLGFGIWKGAWVGIVIGAVLIAVDGFLWLTDWESGKAWESRRREMERESAERSREDRIKR